MAVPVASSAMTAFAKKRLMPKINALADQIRKDTDLMSKLQEAYQKNDMRLAESLVAMSPFGSGFKKLKTQQNELEKAYKEERDAISNRIKENEAKLDKANDALDKSGNLVSGMIESEKYPTSSNIDQFDPIVGKPGEVNKQIAENNDKYSAPTSVGPRGTYNATPFTNAQKRGN